MRFVKETLIKATPEKVFAFHELPDAFARLMPPWDHSKIVQAAPSLKVGSRTIIDAAVFGPIKARWVAEHTAYDPPRMFEDKQLKGPFTTWRHRHSVLPNEQGAILRDEIEYEPPFRPFGRLAALIFIIPRLERLFAYRHNVTKEWAEKSEW